MKNVPAIVNLISGIIFSVLFLVMILYFIFNFKKRYNNSISDGIFEFGYFAAFYPILAFMAFQKNSDQTIIWLLTIFACVDCRAVNSLDCLCLLSLVQKC